MCAENTMTVEEIRAMTPANLKDRFVEKIAASINVIAAADIPNILEIWLFGSCARGTAKIGSDVDLLVVTDGSFGDHYIKGDLRCMIDEPFMHVRGDVVFTSQDALYNVDSIFTRQVRRDGIVLWKKEGIKG